MSQKIKLPPLPAMPSDEWIDLPELLRAYALRAIREFVEGLPIAAGLYTDPQNGGQALLFHQPNVSVYGPNVRPLIIKPELDDAEN